MDIAFGPYGRRPKRSRDYSWPFVLITILFAMFLLNVNYHKLPMNDHKLRIYSVFFNNQRIFRVYSH